MSTTPISVFPASGPTIGAPLHGGESGSFLLDASAANPVAIPFETAVLGICDPFTLDQKFLEWTMSGRFPYDVAKSIFGRLVTGAITYEAAMLNWPNISACASRRFCRIQRSRMGRRVAEK